MIIETKLDYTFTTGMQVAKYNKLHKTSYKIGDTVKVEIKELATKRDYRRRQIKCKCEDCGRIFYKRLDNAINTPSKYCKYCICKNDRHYQWHKQLPEYIKKKISIACSGEKNGFYGKTHTKEHCEKRKLLMIGNKCHLGCKNTLEQLKHISDGVNRGYLDGSRVKTHGNLLRGKYKGLIYQSSYELNFLKHIDKYKLLKYVKRGIVISYTGIDNKQHSYLTDYYIQPLDLIVEIKSTHFWKLDYETNMHKVKAAKMKHNFILVLDNNFTVIDKKLAILVDVNNSK